MWHAWVLQNRGQLDMCVPIWEWAKQTKIRGRVVFHAIGQKLGDNSVLARRQGPRGRGMEGSD